MMESGSSTDASEDTVVNEKPYGVKGDGSDAEEVGSDAEDVFRNSEVADESNIENEVEEWLQLVDDEVTTPVQIRIAEKHMYQYSGETDEVKRYKIKVGSSKIYSGGGADRAAESKSSDAGAEVTDADKENKMGTGGGAVTQGGAVCTCMRRKRWACGTLKGC